MRLVKERMFTQGLSLKSILLAISLIFEERFSGSFCSILLLDEDKLHVLQGVAPHISSKYMGAIDGMSIGPSAGHIGVELKVIDDRALICVKDDGPGIPKEELPFIFNRRWKSQHGTFQNSTGLGLYISKNIIEKQGGKIWAESRSPLGTTISCTLPGVTTSVKKLAT